MALVTASRPISRATSARGISSLSPNEDVRVPHEVVEMDDEPWPFLINDFVSDTTFHGLRYIARRHGRHHCRRLIWLILWLLAMAIFTLLIGTKIQLIYQYPKSINMDIVYNETLSFPAVSICNLNPYRLTAIQHSGLYDIMVNDINPEVNPSASGADIYEWYEDICRIPSFFASASVLISETTRAVCRALCSINYDLACSGFLYDRRQRQCTLTAYTGEWVEAAAGQPACQLADGLEFYRRIRFVDSSEFYCCFDDETNNPCPMTSNLDLSARQESWTLTNAVSASMVSDNTINLGWGHFMQMVVTDLRPGYTARLQSTYRNTTNNCIEFYYWITPGADQPIISLIALTEELIETVVLAIHESSQLGWNRFYANLPAGLNQIIIQGQRSWTGASGFAIDDVRVAQCSSFAAESECMTNAIGNGYRGTQSSSKWGETCEVWADSTSPYVPMLPVLDITSVVNHCQNILGGSPWPTPSCLVRDSTGQENVRACVVSYCPCRTSAMYKCEGGLCIPSSMLCNGVKECPLGDDETVHCGSSLEYYAQNGCDFEDPFACGYTSTRLGIMTWVRTLASASEQIPGPSADADGNTQGYYMMVSASTGLQGDKATLMSPIYKRSQPTLVTFSYSIVSQNVSDPSASLSLYAYTPLNVPLVQLVAPPPAPAGGLSAAAAAGAWSSAGVCVPSGSYYLAFIATHGQPYVTSIALDNILIDPTPCSVNTALVSDGSVNCTFRNNWCGYSLTTTTDNFNYTYTYNWENTDIFGCTTYYGVEGNIVSPNFPDAYDNSQVCDQAIVAPPSSLMTLTFNYVNMEYVLGGCGDVLNIYTQNDTNSPVVFQGAVCGESRPGILAIRGCRIDLNFSSNDYPAGPGQGYNVTYRVVVPATQDLGLVLRLNTDSLSVPDFSQSMTFVSPSFRLYGSSCLNVSFLANSYFQIRLVYEQNSSKKELSLYRSSQKIYMTPMLFDIPYIQADNEEFVLVLESQVYFAGTFAVIDNINLSVNPCGTGVYDDTPLWNSANNTEDMNGFRDISQGDTKWTRACDIAGECFFQVEFVSGPDEQAVLVSPYFSLSAAKMAGVGMLSCFTIQYTLVAPDMLNMEVDLLDLSGTVVSAFAHPSVALTNSSSSIRSLVIQQVVGDNLRLRITAKRYSYDNCAPFCVISLQLIEESVCPVPNASPVLKQNPNCSITFSNAKHLDQQFVAGSLWSCLPDPQTTASGCWYSLYVKVGQHVSGLTQYGQAYDPNSEADCITACGESPTCLSCDWDTLWRTCWFGTTQFPATTIDEFSNHWDVVRSCNGDQLEGLTFSVSPDLYSSIDDADMSNVLTSPQVVLTHDSLMSFYAYLTDHTVSSHLDVYLSSVLGEPMTLLESYVGSEDQDEPRWLCLPAGKYQIVFVGFVQAEDRITLRNAEFTQIPCRYISSMNSDCITGSLCLDRVRSLSQDSINWLYSTGLNLCLKSGVDTYVRYDVEGELIDLYQTVTSFVYFIGPGRMSVDLQITFWWAGCYDWYNGQIAGCVDTKDWVRVWRSENGELIPVPVNLVFNFTYDDYYEVFPFTLVMSNLTTDMVLAAAFSPQAASNIDKVVYSVKPENILPEYHLQFSYKIFTKNDAVHRPNSPLKLGEWASDVYTPSNGPAGSEAKLCVSLNVSLLPLRLRVLLLQGTPSGVNVSRTSVLEVDIAPDEVGLDGMSAKLELNLGVQPLIAQIVIQVSQNAIIAAIDVGNSSCAQPVLEYENETIRCDFDQYDNCGFVDRSASRFARWILKSQASLDNGQYRSDCLITDEGGSYVGNLNVTVSGRACQSWSAQAPHIHPYNDISYFPDSVAFKGATMASIENYCRNPSIGLPLQQKPWCYPIASDFDQEFCIIPRCNDYFMFVQFDARTDMAILESPQYSFLTPVCLQFQFSISSSKVYIRVVVSTPTNLQLQQVLQLTYNDQDPTSVWSTASVPLPDGLTRLQFVADKVGVTVGSESAMIDDVTVLAGQCFEPNSNNGTEIPYTGPRLSQTSYLTTVLNESRDFLMDNLTEMLGPKLHELILDCRFNNQPCDENDFEPEFSNLGMCYTFNKDSDNILVTQTPGSQNGLHLMINIAQYENVLNYGGDLGIKIHLHVQDDIAQVSNLGFAVAPGWHTLAALSYTTTTSLPPPWGTCGSIHLDYYNASEVYTSAKCQLECSTKSLEGTCGCREPYMPGPSTVCRPDQQLGCFQIWKNQNSTSARNTSSCSCPEECDAFSYSPQLSLSGLSIHAVEPFLSDYGDVVWQNVEAQEIENRVDDAIFSQTIELLQNLIKSHSQIRQNIRTNIVDDGTSITNLVYRALSSLVSIASADLQTEGVAFLQQYQDCYNVTFSNTINILTGDLNAGAESLLRLDVIVGHLPYISTYEFSYIDATNIQMQNLRFFLSDAVTKFANLTNKNPDCPDDFMTGTCQSLVSSLVDSLNTYMDQTNCIASTSHCFAVESSSTTTSYTSMQVSETEFSNSVEWTTEFGEYSDNETTTEETTSLPTKQSLSPMPPDFTSNLMVYLQTTRLNMIGLSQCLTGYSSFLTRFNGTLQSLSFGISQPAVVGLAEFLNVLDQDAASLSMTLKYYQFNQVSKLLLAYGFLGSESSSLLLDVDRTLNSIDQTPVASLQALIGGTQTELQTSYLTVLGSLSTMESLMNKKKTAVKDYARHWNLWRIPTTRLQSEQLLDYELDTTQVWQVWPSDQSVSTFLAQSASTLIPVIVEGYCNALVQALVDMQTYERNLQQLFIANMTALQANLLAFNSTTLINNDFASANFIEIDIYFGEMKFQEIVQEASYDLTNFFSDFGGYIGLFLGGSVLSLAEIIDFFAYNGCKKLIVTPRVAMHMKMKEAHAPDKHISLHDAHAQPTQHKDPPKPGIDQSRPKIIVVQPSSPQPGSLPSYNDAKLDVSDVTVHVTSHA